MKGPLGASKARNARPASSAPTSAMPTERRATAARGNPAAGGWRKATNRNAVRAASRTPSQTPCSRRWSASSWRTRATLAITSSRGKRDGPLPPDRDVLDGAELGTDALPAFRNRGAHRVQACLQRNPLPERDEQLVAARPQSIPCRGDLGVDRLGQAQNFRRRLALARQLRSLRPARRLAIEDVRGPLRPSG